MKWAESNQGLFLDPLSDHEQVLAERLRQKTLHPFSGIRVFETDNMKSERLAAVINLGNSAVKPQLEKPSHKIAA